MLWVRLEGKLPVGIINTITRQKPLIEERGGGDQRSQIFFQLPMFVHMMIDTHTRLVYSCTPTHQ